MNKIQENRLLKLAQHLETGKLGHKDFDFNRINGGEFDERGCGTLGCAIGELPIVFPSSWKFVSNYVTRIRSEHIGYFDEETVRLWFGTTIEEDDHLFYPDMQNPKEYGGRVLGSSAKREQVAKNIRAFIEKKHSMAGVG